MVSLLAAILDLCVVRPAKILSENVGVFVPRSELANSGCPFCNKLLAININNILRYQVCTYISPFDYKLL